MLQNHLSQCIVTARTNCPDGYLDVLTEESEEDAETTYSGQVHQTHHTNSTQNSATLITDPLKSLISEKATFE
uniref:Uncharacterized protein n=1 Tax=Setaria digitata TaxID=48799 RepID=A0A915PE65_9BILA